VYIRVEEPFDLQSLLLLLLLGLLLLLMQQSWQFTR
jgi:hypothetical protein